MIEYGAACLLVCVLTYFDRRAAPYAFTIMAGWILGFIGPLAWPWISTGSVLTMAWLNQRNPHWRWRIVTLIAAFMLALDLIYFWFRWRGVHIEVEYAMTLDWCLKAQLVLIGFMGLWNGIVLLGSWGRDHLRGGDRLAVGRLVRGVRKETAG